MRIALIAPPFIPVPPVTYGGTELFVAHLARELQRNGHDVVVYANGESSVPCEVRWLYRTSEWPLLDPAAGVFKNLNHVAWALADCGNEFDVVHLSDGLAVCLSPFVHSGKVLTIHHPHEPAISALYEEHPEVQYVAISRAQACRERMARLTVIHHGVDLEGFTMGQMERTYLSFLGRIAPCKGAHLAIEVAKTTGIPLKLAGEIQPMFRDYWETMVRPHVDGRLIEYVGEVDQLQKHDLLANSLALLFPIQWQEPFGLVMIEAMACGTPVLALPGGSVEEVVEDGISGWICRDVQELACKAIDVRIPPESCRATAVRRFSLQRMAHDYETVYEAVVAGSALAPEASESPLAPSTGVTRSNVLH